MNATPQTKLKAMANCRKRNHFRLPQVRQTQTPMAVTVEATIDSAAEAQSDASNSSTALTKTAMANFQMLKDVSLVQS